MNLNWYEQSLADVSEQDDWLSPWEKPRLWSLHIAKRQGDWRLGRWTAKYAVAEYLKLTHDHETLASIEIRPAASGAPEVFIGGAPARASISLSHRGGRAACAVGAPGAMFGCDLEVIEPRTDAFVGDYFTAEEQAVIREAREADRFAFIALIWSAKESALKAIRTGLRNDTHCVSVKLPVEHHEEAAERGCAFPSASTRPFHCWRPLIVTYGGADVFHGCWFWTDDLVRTLVTVPSVRSTSLGKISWVAPSSIIATAHYR